MKAFKRDKEYWKLPLRERRKLYDAATAAAPNTAVEKITPETYHAAEEALRKDEFYWQLPLTDRRDLIEAVAAAAPNNATGKSMSESRNQALERARARMEAQEHTRYPKDQKQGVGASIQTAHRARDFDTFFLQHYQPVSEHLRKIEEAEGNPK